MMSVKGAAAKGAPVHGDGGNLEQPPVEREICGLVMPIGDMRECSKEHWRDVREIHDAAIEDAGFQCRMVSEADEVRVIHDTIVRNLYNNKILVCDVSHKNPNVMFELGMRLAFDRPVVVVKDDATNFSFDTGVIEHLQYPRDLRFGKIEEFKKSLSEKIKKTYEYSMSKEYSSFLKNFGDIKIAKIKDVEIDGLQGIVEMNADIMREISRLNFKVDALSQPTRMSMNRKISSKSLLMSNIVRETLKKLEDDDIKPSESSILEIYAAIPETFRREFLKDEWLAHIKLERQRACE